MTFQHGVLPAVNKEKRKWDFTKAKSLTGRHQRLVVAPSRGVCRVRGLPHSGD